MNSTFDSIDNESLALNLSNDSSTFADWTTYASLLLQSELNNLTITTTVNNSNFPSNSSKGDEISDAAEHYSQVQNWVDVLVPIFFGVIAVTGFFGNLLVILVVLLNQQMHSTTNLMIVNLAIADLLFVVFCVPFTATDYVAEYWPFGDFWCRSVQYLIVVTVMASIYTLVLMSIDRFLAVVHPIRSRMLRTENITKIAILTLWVVILTIAVPVPLMHGVVVERYTDLNSTYVYCTIKPNDYVTQLAYQIIYLVCTYLLPLMIISGLYMRMLMRLWRQSGGVRMSVESQRGRKRVTRLVVVVVVAFALLWLPVQLILMLRALGVYQANTVFKATLQIAAQTLAYFSSCINPVLYAFLSDNFRKAFHKAIDCSKRYQSCASDLPPPRHTSYARTSTTGL